MQGIYLELLDQDWVDIASYNWASAPLAFLYRNLCQAALIKKGKPTSDIAGPLVNLQVVQNLSYIYIIMTLLNNFTYISLYYAVVDMEAYYVLHSCCLNAITRRRRGEDGQPIILHVKPEDPTEDEPYGSRWLVPRLTHLNTSRVVHVFCDSLDRMASVQVF